MFIHRLSNFIMIITILIIILLAGCTGSKSDAATAIESYIQALGNKDINQISSMSCADWEQNALIEVDSLTAVGTKVEDLSCEVAGEEGDNTLIACSGIIALDYGGEAQQIDLSNRTYVARQEVGEWRMCGYK
jgi:hypothetical protein